MRPPFDLRWGTLAAAAVFVTVVLAAVFASHAAAPPTPVRAAPPTVVEALLERCNNGGFKAADDPVCQAAWKAARDHFFGQTGRAKP